MIITVRFIHVKMFTMYTCSNKQSLSEEMAFWEVLP